MNDHPVSPGDIFMWLKNDSLHIVTEKLELCGGWKLLSLRDPSDWCWDEENNLLNKSRVWQRVA